MDYFYTVVILCCILGMIILAIDIGKNTIIPIMDIKWFRSTFILVAIGALCEWLGVLFVTLQLKPIWLHLIITTTEFSISPFLSLFLARSCGIIRTIKKMFYVFFFHVILEIFSIPCGAIFYIDENSIFHRGDFYWIYLAVCIIAFAYIMAIFFVIAKKAKLHHIITTVLISIIMISGQIATILDSEVYTGYISIALTATYLYITVQSLFRRQMIDTLDMEQEIANHDSLTGVPNRHSFERKVDQLNSLISIANPKVEFAICECDINNLKIINDTYGHSVGDQYIKNCCKVICNIFKHSPVYRIGGDEFVIVIQNEEYSRYEAIKNNVKDFIKTEAEKKCDIFDKNFFAAGFAVYDVTKDNSFKDVFKRADEEMYKNKKEYKKYIKSK